MVSLGPWLGELYHDVEGDMLPLLGTEGVVFPLGQVEAPMVGCGVLGQWGHGGRRSAMSFFGGETR